MAKPGSKKKATKRPEAETVSHSFCIVSRKMLDKNTRITRQAMALNDNGHKVTVIALKLPEEEIIKKSKGVDYVIVDLQTPFQKNLAKLKQSWLGKALDTLRPGKAIRLVNRLKQKLIKLLLRVWDVPGALVALVFVALGKALQLAGTGLRWGLKALAQLLSALAHHSKRAGNKAFAVCRSLGNSIRRGWSMLGRVLIEVAFYMAIGYGAVLAAPLIAVAVVCTWGALLSLYGAIRLQTPKDIDPEVSLGDVLRMNWFKLVHGLVRPYIPRMQNSTLKKEALRELADKEFDVVQAHDSYAVEAAEALAKRHKHTRLVFDAVEVFKEMSGGAFQRLPKWYANRLHDDVARRMKRSADRVMTFGPGAAEFMAEEYDIRKPDLIRNCRGYLEIKPDTRLREDAGLGKGDKAVVMLNTLYQGQGLEQVIEAMQHLPDDVHICTIGWDTGRGYMDDCFRMAEKAGVIDRLHFMGRRPTWDLVPYASGGDIALMPRQLNNNLNNYYSMPNRIFEAIMARLPLACSSLRDVKHLVETMDAGMAFDETDPKDIARVISYLLEPENLKHYKHQTEQAARLLCWENESRSYVRIMEAVARDDRFYRQEEFTDAYEVEPEYLAMLKRKLKEAAQPEKVTGGDEQDAEKARAVA